MPLIEKFLSAGFKVIIAAGGDQKILLQSVFPQLEFVEIKGYRVKYGSTKWETPVKIFLQIPKILIAINRENKWLKRFVTAQHPDVIVSDNRFGLHHKGILSVFITHQLGIKTSFGKIADRIAQKINYFFINQFDYCWVPDTGTGIPLAGELSHPSAKPVTPVQYIGWLSAIKKEALPVSNPVLLLLSGPEPQRTIFENMLLQQLDQIKQAVILVRGLPSATAPLPPRNGLTVYNYLSGQQLQQVINASAVIVSRAGYSTLMDILPLEKKCIVVATPGQAEQEYLAAWLGQHGYVCACPQHALHLASLLEKVSQLPTSAALPGNNEGPAADAISRLQATLNNRPQQP